MSPKHLKPGTYYIRNALSETMLNIVRKEPGEAPNVCVYNVHESSTQKWQVEKGADGFRIRNLATELYMARDSVGIPQAKDAVLATQRPIEWQIVEKADGYHVIKLARTPSLVLDVAPNMNPEKADLVLSLVVADKGLRQGWKFEWVEAEEPPLYARNIYIGPVPPGIYWLGQADENVGVAAAAKAPSVAGLTVAARLPLQEGEAASLHLSPVGNAPWPNQMWAVESGARGYRFRNLGTDTYLNYVNREPVAEPSSTGPSYSSEWCLKKPPSQAEGDLSAYIISPSADLNCLLAIMTNESFKKLGVKQPSFFQGPWSYMAWRFEPVDEMVLDLP